MRIVHVNFDAAPTGGASIAMLRIHEALLEEGVESIIVCDRLAKAPQSIACPRKGLLRVAHFMYRAFMKVVFGQVYATGLSKSGKAKVVNSLNPDVVVLHWLQGETIGLSELKQIKAPMFWMHHDMWPSLGLTTYPGLSVKSRFKWLSDILERWLISYKRKVYHELRSRLFPAATNDWVGKVIAEKGLFGDNPVTTIPYPLSPVFMEAQSRLKEQLRNKNEKFTILNGSNFGFCAGVKGADRLMKAIELIPAEERVNMCIKIFGGYDGPSSIADVPVEYLGRFEGVGLVPVYHQADVFAFPSRQETFGQTKIEALSCGTPVVAFNQTACAKGIVHGSNGWIAEADDVESFAEGLRWVYHQWREGVPLRVKSAVEEYAPSTIARSWMLAAERIKSA